MKKIAIITFSISINLFAQVPIFDFYQTYGIRRTDSSFDFCQTPDQALIICGRTANSQNRNVFTLKVDFDGKEIWKKIYDQGEAYSIKKINNNNYVVTGIQSTRFEGDIIYNPYLLKIDMNGDTLWTKIIHRNVDIRTIDCAVTEQNEIYLLCTYHIAYNPEDAFIIKLDSTGNILWEHLYERQGDDRCSGLIQINDNLFFVIGSSHSDKADRYDYDIQIFMIDENGEQIFLKEIGSEYEVFGYKAIKSIDGNIIISGYVDYGFPHHKKQLIIMKYDINGNPIWSKKYEMFESYSFVESPIDSSLFICSIKAGSNIEMMKLNSIGDSLITITHRFYSGYGFDYYEYYLRSGQLLNLTDYFLVGAEVHPSDPTVTWDSNIFLMKFSYKDLVSVSYKNTDNFPTSNSIYPNPFNFSTTIGFYLNKPSNTTFEVYNINGMIIEHKSIGHLINGQHKYQWHPDQLPSGVYYYRFLTDWSVISGKCTLIK